MAHYQGSCHCGAVLFSFEGEEITKGLRCNCSICSRKGAIMTPFVIAPELFKIDAQDNALGLYQFGSKTAKHYFCNRCGIYTFHETARKLVSCIELNVPIRALQKGQGEAQSAGNGVPFPRTATKHWPFRRAP